MGFLSKEKEAEASTYSTNNDFSAPPPYSSVPGPGPTNPSQQYQQSDPSPFDVSADYRAPLPSANVAPMPRIFHLYNQGLSGRKQTVMENDKTTKAYDVQRHSMSKPHLEITSGATGQNVGAVSFHFFSRSLDLVINGNEVTLDSEGWFKSSYGFLSSIGKLRWEHTSMWGGTMVCLTETGEWLARFDRSYWAMSKEGKLEIVNTQLPKGLVDELVVTGLAMVEVERRRNSAAASSGAAAGGAAGAC